MGTKCKCEAPTLKLNLKRHTSSTRLLSARLRSRLCRVILVAPDLRVRSLGQFVPRLMKALKGHDMPAQGSALGIGLKNGLALKGRDIVLGRGVCLPDDGTGIQPSFMFASVSQGFTLGWDGARRWRFSCTASLCRGAGGVVRYRRQPPAVPAVPAVPGLEDENPPAILSLSTKLPANSDIIPRAQATPAFPSETPDRHAASHRH